MKSVEESVVIAMDGSDVGLFTYLPYILQDIWEIGSVPEIIINLLKKHLMFDDSFKVLDLGCGKGAVSVKLAKALNCTCFGIDAIPEFIQTAKEKAKEYGVDSLCQFEVGDIRFQIENLSDYDVIILGSIGPVLGDTFATLSILEKVIKYQGFIILDDGYIDDNSNYTHDLTGKRSDLMKQIADAGMTLIDEVIIQREDIKQSDYFIFERLQSRCLELMEKEPQDRQLFADYIQKQEEENEALEEKLICSTMLIQNQNKTNHSS